MQTFAFVSVGYVDGYCCHCGLCQCLSSQWVMWMLSFLVMRVLVVVTVVTGEGWGKGMGCLWWFVNNVYHYCPVCGYHLPLLVIHVIVVDMGDLLTCCLMFCQQGWLVFLLVKCKFLVDVEDEYNLCLMLILLLVVLRILVSWWHQLHGLVDEGSHPKCSGPGVWS